MHSQFEPSESHQNTPQTATEHAADNEAENVAARNEAKTLLERFLDQVCASPGKAMTDSEKDEMRQELRAHLLAAALAYEELGSEPAAAMQEAIARFGNAAFVGKGLRQAYRPSRFARKASALHGLLSIFIGGNLWVYTAGFVGLRGVYDTPVQDPQFWLGAPLGLLIAALVWRKRTGLLRSALLAGTIQFAMAVTGIAIIAARSHYPFGGTLIQIIAGLSLTLAISGVATGAIASMIAQGLRHLEQKEAATETPPALS